VKLEGGCEIYLEEVQVAYTQNRKVLDHVNMWVPSGKIVALIGPSGEGKTTLLRLMLGLIPPEAGEVYIQEGTGKRYDLGADTRHVIAYVPQGNTMIAGTIRENLLLARPDADEIRLRRALVDACAWEFVSKLPKQMDTPIGEGGKGLSEGQAQRIAIARALLKEAPILLLDEVTSALDQDTERRVLENLTRRQVTTVVTTHRPSILRQCVHAYRVKDSKVQLIEKEELIKLAGNSTE
jgi:ABC-type bacteriocin/lantibiotic exporter with double-glycine peptidase domain